MAGATKRTTLEARLGHGFREPALLDQALTHSSALDGGQAGSLSDNERLEFLGDRVLGLSVASALYRRYPSADEGELALRFNALVRKETCAEIARELDLGAAVKLGEAEARSGGRKLETVLANACEAVIGALYLDGGFDVAQRFVETAWGERFEEAVSVERDAKTRLQEWAQGEGRPLPTYETTGRSGPDHAPSFVVSVRVGDDLSAEGAGPSKRKAEQAAAESLLERLDGKNQ